MDAFFVEVEVLLHGGALVGILLRGVGISNHGRR